MGEKTALNENCPAVQTHLTMMQGVIGRMAENSRSCKVWCVTLVAAVLVFGGPDWRSAARADSLGPDAALPVPGHLLPCIGAGLHQVSEYVR